MFLLAQTLVRRSLFPFSDCLKAGQREHMIYQEILSHNADIMTLQEVDRLDKLLPVLSAAGYAFTYAAGPSKKHGCLVAYRKSAYEAIGEKMVQYDEQEVRQDNDSGSGERRRRGMSFKTKNIASLVALRKIGTEEGFIMATTHLFWHPRYNYERARQAGIMFREAVKFREETGRSQWPCILSGDFNFTPADPAYALLVSPSAPLSTARSDQLAASRVVHYTVDPSVPKSSKVKAEDEEEGAESSKDEPADDSIPNTRPAVPADGLLSDAELAAMFGSARLRSAYNEGQKKRRQHNRDVKTFGDRTKMTHEEQGVHEPEWTSYTHYWKTVLDYIFILDPPGWTSEVIGYATPLDTQTLDPGIPRKGVCGSDHVSLCAELGWRESV
ncbi:hypothetical protein PLICRDRAFT_35787 [Plicaturopsis crispa FD-325 SS-3]|nr:hypothetical protein PLICRDRAFT_35787 [Plicaturopsis crispa FD-325 SS-3]